MINKHLTSALCAMALGVVASHAQLLIDGHTAVLDSLTGTYLCPVSRAHFGNTLNAVVTIDSLASGKTVNIDGTDVASGDTFAFDGISGSKQWAITEMQDDSTTVARKIAFTYLPVVVMNGTFGYDYAEGTVQVLDPDRYSDETMLARVKWRGGTTNVDGKNKRNYHLKFIDENGEKQDRKFFGLRNDNSWIMDAAQVDFLRVRNRVATELWRDFATKPYHAAQEPKAKTWVDGHEVEVILNGNYAGIYALTEAMDRKTLKLKKFDETTGEIHGQLWKASTLTGCTTFHLFSPYDNTQEEWNGLETKYPELDEVSPTDYGSALGQTILFCDTASMTDFNLKAHTYLDMPVMIDYEIFLQTILGIDNYAKNIYWYTYDTPASPMLSLAVWDLDTSMGGNWNPVDFHPETMSPTRKFSGGNTIFTAIMRPSSIYYKQSLARYNELRQGVLGTESLIARYTAAVKEITDCGAVAREQARWSHDSDLNGRELNIDSELQYATSWIEQRMSYLDANRYQQPLLGDVNNDHIVDIEDLNLVVNAALNGNLGYYTNASTDVNGDQVTDITDINQITNILLNQLP